MTSDDVRRYRVHLDKMSLKPATVTHLLSDLRALLNRAEDSPRSRSWRRCPSRTASRCACCLVQVYAGPRRVALRPVTSSAATSWLNTPSRVACVASRSPRNYWPRSRVAWGGWCLGGEQPRRL